MAVSAAACTLLRKDHRLDATSTRGVVAKLPKPSARAGAGVSFSPAIFMGPSILGDLGSASWNITHRDADGKMRNWGSTLYLSSTSSNALAHLWPVPRAAYCPAGTTPLAGFKKVGTVTVAVVCHGPAITRGLVDGLPAS